MVTVLIWLIIGIALLSIGLYLGVGCILIYDFICFHTKKYWIPFVQTNIRFVEKILDTTFKKYVKTPCDFVELGAGLGYVSKVVATKKQWTNIYCVETNPGLILLAKVYKLLHQAPLTLVQKDFNDFDIPKNSVVYCFLSQHAMHKLYADNKFRGCLVISVHFYITIPPTEKLKIKARTNNKLYDYVYIYDFR